MYSLWKAITGGSDWQDYGDALFVIDWGLGVIFTIYIAFAVCAMLNVVIGIFANKALKIAEGDMDLKLLKYFADSGAPFMMEVAARTDADKKGGHLAVKKADGGLTLRESAQCPPEDEKAFQDTTRYQYFNTNNLWVDLEKLKALFQKHGGAIPLPVMLNDKTVDPRDKKSTKVVQLETAMGAAISSFEGAIAILIPRTRFAPVKKCDDLLALRSDAYVLTDDFRMELAPQRNGIPPTVKLDDMYKFVDAMDTLIPNGVPSLLNCKSLKIEVAVEFAAGVVIKGDVKITNAGKEKKVVVKGVYENTTLAL